MFHLSAFLVTYGYLSLIQASLLPQDHEFLRSSHRLSVRQQISNVPDQCKSNCDPANSLIAAGCTPSQCCTDTFEREYGDCLGCVGEALNATDYAAAQQDLDFLFEQCESRGFMLPTPSALPGQNPNRQLSTSFPMTATPTSLVVTLTAVSAVQTQPTVSTGGPTNQFPSGTSNANPPAPSANWAVGNDISLTGYMSIFSSLAVGLYIWLE